MATVEVRKQEKVYSILKYFVKVTFVLGLFYRYMKQIKLKRFVIH